jgi:HlyD family secretion protein
MRDVQAESLRLVSLPGWLWLVVLGLTIAAGIAYGFFGVVTRVVEGAGVTRFEVQVLTVSAPQAGIVRKVLLARGDEVKAGEAILELSSEVIEAEIKQAQELLAFLEDEHATLQAGEKKMLEEATRRRDSALRESEDSERAAGELLGLRRELLGSQEDLLERGLISQETVLESRTAVASLEARIINARTQAANAELEVAQLEATVAADRAGRREARRDAKSGLDDLEARRAERFVVRSFLDGQVDDIFARPGTSVRDGEVLARLVSEAGTRQQLRVAAVLPQSMGKELSVGDEVQVVPAFVDKSRYGFIRGRLRWITTYAATPAELALVVATPFEIERLQARFGALLLAEVEIQRDPQTESGLAWSTTRGWPGEIGPGVQCSLQVVYREDRPVELLYPWIRSVLGR